MPHRSSTEPCAAPAESAVDDPKYFAVPDRPQAGAYIADLTAPLVGIAERAGEPFLAYLLTLSTEEARRLAKRG